MHRKSTGKKRRFFDGCAGKILTAKATTKAPGHQEEFHFWFRGLHVEVEGTKGNLPKLPRGIFNTGAKGHEDKIVASEEIRSELIVYGCRNKYLFHAEAQTGGIRRTQRGIHIYPQITQITQILKTPAEARIERS